MSELMKNKKFNNRNYELKAYMYANHVSYERLGEYFGLSKRTIQRRLNNDLSERETDMMMKVIEKIITDDCVD